MEEQKRINKLFFQKPKTGCCKKPKPKKTATKTGCCKKPKPKKTATKTGCCKKTKTFWLLLFQQPKNERSYALLI